MFEIMELLDSGSLGSPGSWQIPVVTSQLEVKSSLHPERTNPVVTTSKAAETKILREFLILIIDLFFNYNISNIYFFFKKVSFFIFFVKKK